MCLKSHSAAETAFRIGIALVSIGILVFFGATPGAISGNPVGSAWIYSTILVLAGFILIGIHRFSHR